MSKLEVMAEVWGRADRPVVHREAVLDSGASRTVVGAGAIQLVNAVRVDSHVLGRDVVGRKVLGALYRVLVRIKPAGSDIGDPATCESRVDAFVPDDAEPVDFTVVIGADFLQATGATIDMRTDSIVCASMRRGVAPCARPVAAAVSRRNRLGRRR